ncbi:hydrogenase maturation nickel metallochaperone HypA/HybF [Caproiciproducens sp. LBM24188]|nr:hydrogenase maturation nickel metallochaperone HypA [Clostridiales bacterium]
MHELPIVLDVVRVVEEEAKARGLSRVTKIYLVLGELSSVVDESVQMYFEIVSKDTVCSDAKLVFEYVPASLKCGTCGKVFPHKGSSFQCPDCGGDSVLMRDTGREFYIRSFDGT